MPKKDLIKLIEALDLVDLKIISLEWDPPSYGNHYRETINLKLLKESSPENEETK